MNPKHRLSFPTPNNKLRTRDTRRRIVLDFVFTPSSLKCFSCLEKNHASEGCSGFFWALLLGGSGPRWRRQKGTGQAQVSLAAAPSSCSLASPVSNKTKTRFKKGVVCWWCGWAGPQGWSWGYLWSLPKGEHSASAGSFVLGVTVWPWRRLRKMV